MSYNVVFFKFPLPGVFFLSLAFWELITKHITKNLGTFPIVSIFSGINYQTLLRISLHVSCVWELMICFSVQVWDVHNTLLYPYELLSTTDIWVWDGAATPRPGWHSIPLWSEGIKLHQEENWTSVAIFKPLSERRVQQKDLVQQ